MNRVFQSQLNKRGNVFMRDGYTHNETSFIEPDVTVAEVVEKSETVTSVSRLDPPEVEGGSIETINSIMKKLQKRRK